MSIPTNIRADITGSLTAKACGIVSHGPSPVLALCRQLVAAGHDPATPLEAYRGDMLCLRIRSIGEAAELRINTHGTAFIRGCERPTASYVSRAEVVVYSLPPAPANDSVGLIPLSSAA